MTERGTRPGQIALLALTLALAGLACLPGFAAAAGALNNSGTLEFNAAAGETNNLTLAKQGNAFIFTDSGAPIAPGAGCAFVTPNQVSCPAAGVDRISVELGNLGDRFTVVGTIRLPCCSGVVARGEADNDVLNTGVGRSEFFGDGGQDTLNGNAGRDRLVGGPGNDVLNGAGAGDTLEGNEGNDVEDGGAGSDSFTDNSSTSSVADGADVLSGGSGRDTLSHSSRDDGVTVDLDGVADDGAGCPGPGCGGDNVMPDVENVEGGAGNDVLTGNGSANLLDDFGGGDDQFNGLGGDDRLRGFDGDDVMQGGAGADILDDGADADRLLGGRGDDFLIAQALDLAADAYSGGRGADGVDFVGGQGKGLVTVYGGIHFALRVSLDGRPNDGTVSPLISGPKDNAKADLEDIVSGEGSDVLIGNKRANQILGGDGNDRIVGLGGPDGLLGENGNDKLTGGKGRDLLDGAGGADRLTSRDKKPDEVRCGASTDRVKGDRSDHLAADCDKRRLK